MQARFAHADDAAAADLDAGAAHAVERIEAVLVIAGGDDVAVDFRCGIEIVVVVIEAGALQAFSLAFAEHTQRGASFQAQCLDFAHHFFDFFQVTVFRFTPCSSHTETGCAMRLGLTCGFQHGIQRQDFLRGDTSVVTRCLRAVAAVFRAAASLDRQQCRQFDFIRVEIFAMRLLGLEHQFVERQVEQIQHALHRPFGVGWQHHRLGGWLECNWLR